MCWYAVVPLEPEKPVTPPLFELPSRPGLAIGKRLTLVASEGRRAVFLGSTAIHVIEAGDRAGEAACMAMLSRAGLATDHEIARAFGCHRNTVVRLAGRLSRGGMGAVVPAKRGPKGPHKATAAVLAVISEEGARLGPTALARLIVERTGVALSRSHVTRLTAGLVRRDELALQDTGEAAADVIAEIDAAAEGAGEEAEPAAEQVTVAGATRAEEEADDDGGVGPAVLAEPENTAAFDPPATLPAQTRGRYMGLALYYPALAALGLVDVARGLFRLPRSERFGVRATALSVFFMTLLSKTTVESAKHLRRREFGAVIGTGRAPSVKTLRRKFAELVAQGQAAEFGVGLARCWVEGGIVATAYLYVDGHMKQYTGKRRLQEVWNSQRRMPLPGIHTYHVNDVQGRPLLFLTEQLSTNLAKAMPRIIESIREVIGERRFTVIFDRGGYDGKLFGWLHEQQVDFITYQRGEPTLAVDRFKRQETRFEGRRVRFLLAEDEIQVGGTGPWRRIVVRTRDGHQTPIVTNVGSATSAPRIASLMFARWRQENLFKYMAEHHGLDNLISYAAEAADPQTGIPNPERKRIDRQLAEQRQELARLQQGLGAALLDEPRSNSRSAHGLKIAQAGSVGQLRAIEVEIERLIKERKQAPAYVSLAEAKVSREVMRLEHKAIVDRIKISAYNAEEWLLDRLVAHYSNHHDVRDLLRAFAELSGEITTTPQGVVVTLDPPDTPIHRRALEGLVHDLNALGATFPGTDVPVTYRVVLHHSRAAA